MTGLMGKLRPILWLLISCGFCEVTPINGATLSGEFTPVPQGEIVNLTAEGPLDWVHWGLITGSSVDRKSGVTPRIPDFTPLGPNGPYQYGDNFNGYSWTDGTPTPAATNTTTGVWMYGKSNGFQLNFAAGPSTNIVKLYVGTFGAVGKFDATLGGTTLKYSDSSLTNASNGPGGLYTLTCAADSPAQTLTVKFVVERTLDPAGNVTLQAAALTAPGANNPPTISIGDPVGGADFSAHDNITIVADAADADGTIMKVEFFQNGARLGESSSSPYSLTWSNVPAGNFVLTANATDNGGATATSAPVEISVSGGGGALSGSSALPPATVDLTAEGTSDWAHWGRASANSFDHKTGVPQQISNFTEIGTNDVQRYSDNYTAFSWTDGTPTASNNGTTTGVFIHGMTNGFSITAPADATVRTLKVYVGLNAAQGNFQAYLSDFSAPAYTDASPGSIFGNAYAVYTLNYAAASAGQTLIINYAAKTLYDANFGNVTLQAASLSDGGVPTNAPPTVVIANPTNNAAFTAPANMTITADASDSDGSISRVEFFDAADKLGETTNSPYSLAWSNVAAGTYTLTAKATDNLGATATSAPVTVSITNATALPVAIVDSAINGGQFQCRFQTRNGDSYTVEFTDSLNPVQWQTLTNLTGNGSIADVTDITLIGGERYYRVSAP